VSDTTEIAQCMYDLANTWPVYWVDTERPGVVSAADITPGPRYVEKITRCERCDEEIYFQDVGHLSGVVRHLLNSHGYRMDGRQFDNQNRLVGHA
jgi:hypothetical protein